VTQSLSIGKLATVGLEVVVVVDFVVLLVVVVEVLNTGVEVVVVVTGGRNIDPSHSKNSPWLGRILFSSRPQHKPQNRPIKISGSFIFLGLSATKLDTVMDHPFKAESLPANHVLFWLGNFSFWQHIFQAVAQMNS